MHRMFLDADKLSRTLISPAADVTAWEREMDSPREIGRSSRAALSLGRLVSRGERLYRLHLPAPRLRQAGGLAAEIQIAEEGAKR